MNNTRRNTVVTAVVLAVIAALVTIGVLVQAQRDTTGEHAETPRGVTSAYGVMVGDADAPTKIVLYEDFQCPVCGVLEAGSADALRQAVEAGKVTVEYRMVSFLDRASLNDYSSRAANAALVVLDQAGADAFWAFHDLLYADQPDEGTAGPEDDALVDLAVQAGADRDTVEQGIDDGWFDQWVVNATDAMSKHGVSGTPTALIDGRVAGSTPQETLDAVLDAAA